MVRLLEALANFNDRPTLEKQVQTNIEVDDLMRMDIFLILDIKIRDMDKTIRSRSVQYDRSQTLLLEERMFSFQRELEEVSAVQLREQVLKLD